MKNILLIHNKSEYSDQLKAIIQVLAFNIIFTDSFSHAWDITQSHKIQIVLMDTHTHYGDGLEFCSKLRGHDFQGKIIFLSSNQSESIILKAFESGADDYLKIPMPIEELKVRLKKFMPLEIQKSKLAIGELLIHPQKRILKLMGKYVKLGKKEFDIFYHIVQRRSSIVERRTLLELIYEDESQPERVIDSHISHIRAKLWQLAGPKIQIQAIYGRGYTIIYQD